MSDDIEGEGAGLEEDDSIEPPDPKKDPGENPWGLVRRHLRERQKPEETPA
jgi:hypothetical protein